MGMTADSRRSSGNTEIDRAIVGYRRSSMTNGTESSRSLRTPSDPRPTAVELHLGKSGVKTISDRLMVADSITADSNFLILLTCQISVA
jgi:hypothetical protein